MTLDLSKFGLPDRVDLTGTVEGSWLDGDRLVFLFGEFHSYRGMKQRNIRNACTQIDAGAVNCVGTDVPMAELDRLTQDEIASRSAELFASQKTDEAVVNYLSLKQPPWYGGLEFGSTVKVLRPSTAVGCVEDQAHRDQIEPIRQAYLNADSYFLPPPCPDYPTFGDHPDNYPREDSMIENLLRLWSEVPAGRAAILNTGSVHSVRIAQGFRERGVSYYVITQPRSPDPLA